MASTSRRWATSRDHALVLLAAAAASVLFTWPLAPNLRGHILRAIYAWDAYTNAMIMGSRVDAVLGRGSLGIYDNYFFAPLPHTIVFNENHFGLSLLFAPFYLAGDNPLLAYNLTLLASLSLSVFFTYLLVRRLTGSSWAGFLSGVAFAFSPYVFFELGRIQLVATQWIPACFYFLHRALEGRRVRDIAGFWAFYLLQIGTCLYYAMFLVPLLAAVGGYSWLRKRPPRRTTVTLLGLGALAGAITLALLYPYFTERKNFDLERSLAFAASYDGKLAFFAHVPETNLGLTSLRYRSNPWGAHEEIAFPGFTVLGLASLALAVHAFRAFRSWGAALTRRVALCTFVALLLGAAATLLAHSMLAGLVVVVAVGLSFRRALPFVPPRARYGLYLAVLALSVLLFLGLEPFEWRGRPVHGLYYYLYTYFPGYNGIRKVSRQAVMTTFLAAVLAGFGGAALFARARTLLARGVLFVVLFGAMTLELRSFPHPLEEQWAGASVPPVYRFLAGLPQRDLLAITPQNDGRERFWGDAGMALHNYLALYHKHRFVDGQSSYTLPVTDLAARALATLPSESAHTVLCEVGTNHLLIHAADLPTERAHLPEQLRALPDDYRPIFRDGADHVFSLLCNGPRIAPLAPTPPLPASSRRLATADLAPASALEPARTQYAADGDPDSFWSSLVPQAPGQAFEIRLRAPHRITALEIENPGHELFLPMSYVLEATLGEAPFRVLVRRPELTLFRAQIFAPKQFVYRIVLPEPIAADRLRLSVDRPMPGVDFVVHEAHVYVER